MATDGTPTLDSADRQTVAAYVTFTTSPEGPALSVGVPEEHSIRLLETLRITSGVMGSVTAPYLMAKALDAAKVTEPWQVPAAFLTLSVLLPLLYICLYRRSS
ncbi:hypothetical protein ACQEVG_22940 [Streptomyces sp. CA-135486]|uniref:hypothetical protein n=1 Tax=Streptomyces sp. CA-135486 TaxID=3240049 RepID=UPI003D8C6D73